MTAHSDRIRTHTAAEVLQRIDGETEQHLRQLADGPADATARRLGDLAREWDTDRTVEAEAATMGLMGLALGLLWDRRLLVVPAVVAAGMLTHALTGRYPLMPLFRRLGVRTAAEIARERHALKALRGDFDHMGHGPDATSPPEADGLPRPADLH